MEQWKDINGYEGLYQISNMGRVKSLPKMMRNRNGLVLRKGKILKPNVKENDYLFIGLTKNYKRKMFYMHRLVAIHFIGNPGNKPHVNHLKSDKTDNRYFMLEWATAKENIIHSFMNGIHKGQKGTLSPAAKLDDSKVLEIKNTYSKGGISIRAIANTFGVHHSVINGILQGRRWSHV